MIFGKEALRYTSPFCFVLPVIKNQRILEAKKS
jgi:hypothetical protein